MQNTIDQIEQDDLPGAYRFQKSVQSTTPKGSLIRSLILIALTGMSVIYFTGIILLVQQV